MATSTNFDQIRRSQLLYIGNIAAKIAAASTGADDSARTWDRFDGFIDSTNSDKTSALTTDTYKTIFDRCSAIFSDSAHPHIIAYSYFKENMQERKATGWRRFVPFANLFKAKSIEPEFHIPWLTGLEWEETHAFATNSEAREDVKEFLLNLSFSNEVNLLERNIPELIRRPVRDRLKNLLDDSIDEQSDAQDLLKIGSLKAFYRFLEYCKSPAMPSLTLTWDGHIYAEWRESNESLVSARFVSSSRVEYVVRSRTEQFSASSSPSRFFKLLSSLDLIDLIAK